MTKLHSEQETINYRQSLEMLKIISHSLKRSAEHGLHKIAEEVLAPLIRNFVKICTSNGREIELSFKEVELYCKLSRDLRIFNNSDIRRSIELLKDIYK